MDTVLQKCCYAFNSLLPLFYYASWSSQRSFISIFASQVLKSLLRLPPLALGDNSTVYLMLLAEVFPDVQTNSPPTKKSSFFQGT